MGITAMESSGPQPQPEKSSQDDDWYEEIGTEEEKEILEDSDMIFFMN